MILRFVFTSILLLGFKINYSQNYKKITYSFRDTCYNNMNECFKGKDNKKSIVSFNYGFNNLVMVRLNKKPVLNRVINSSDSKEVVVSIDYKNLRKNKSYIELIISDSIFYKIKLIPKYHLIEIYKFEDNLSVIYAHQSSGSE